MFKLDLEKAEEPDIESLVGSLKKQETSRKTPTFVLLTMPKLLTVWITPNYGKFLKRREYQTLWYCLSPEKPVCGSRVTIRTGHGTTDWSQIGKGVHQACILSPCLFH